MNLDQLERQYSGVEQSVVGDPELPYHYDVALHEVQDLMQPLFAEDISEWVSRQYREAYRAKQQDERSKPLCACSSRRCRLKNGKLPYQLRRRSSSFTRRPSPEEQLQSYLKRHPEAVVISEALDNLRERKAEVAKRLSTIESALSDYSKDIDPLPKWVLPDDMPDIELYDPGSDADAEPEPQEAD